MIIITTSVKIIYTTNVEYAIITIIIEGKAITIMGRITINVVVIVAIMDNITIIFIMVDIIDKIQTLIHQDKDLKLKGSLPYLPNIQEGYLYYHLRP